MAEQLKDFADIPQSFIKEGTLVSALRRKRVVIGCKGGVLTLCSLSTGVPSQRKRVSDANTRQKFYQESNRDGEEHWTDGRRIHPAMPSSGYWIRGDGLHWIPRQVDPHPYVSGAKI